MVSAGFMTAEELYQQGEGFCTREEAARVLNCSVEHINEMVERGEILASSNETHLKLGLLNIASFPRSEGMPAPTQVVGS